MRFISFDFVGKLWVFFAILRDVGVGVMDALDDCCLSADTGMVGFIGFEGFVGLQAMGGAGLDAIGGTMGLATLGGGGVIKTGLEAENAGSDLGIGLTGC